MSSFSRRPAPVTRQPSGWETTGSEPPVHPLRSSGRRSLEVVESGGTALADAQEAFIDSTRAVWTRIVWSLPSEHDARVLEVLERMRSREVRYELARLGLAVDWVTYRDTQMTRDKILQQDVLINDPASSVLVYVFRLASDQRWIALWRKRIMLPADVLSSQSSAISRQKRLLLGQERDYVIKISYPTPQDESTTGRWGSFRKREVRV
ncbi:hypothetical protein FRC09_010017 [Ceratobasidium sp. 395]|nr:hypothetical protein FRC09_010017 [Ceratobasidium sp. 395]